MQQLADSASRSSISFEPAAGFRALVAARATGALRAGLLSAANSNTLRRFVGRYGFSLGAARFVAGETLPEFLTVARAVNQKGLFVAAGLLGEDVRDRNSAVSAAQEYTAILQRVSEERLRANVALKLTHLGLAIDRDLAYQNVANVAGFAETLRNFVRIDMEQSSFVDATLDTYRRLHASGHHNVGVVLQAYLYRSESDLSALLPLSPNIRLVKGAYLEPASVAFPKKADVDKNYARLIEISLRDGGFTAIATHDERIIEHAIDFATRNAIRGDRYEFQMLYGVRPQLQLELAHRGYPVRIAVPFGTQWYPYLMRRLAERPANLFFFLRSLWRG